jgi:sugar phosphate isomerase/epimerase
MSSISRRQVAAGLALAPFWKAAAAPPKIRVGIMDGMLGRVSRPEALPLAASLGFEGVQVTLGRPGAAGGRLPLSDTALCARFREQAAASRVAITSTYLDVLHADCLKNTAAAAEWVREGIAVTRTLETKVLMLVFFGKCALNPAEDLDTIAAALKPLAKEAAGQGVTLGFENTLSARASARVLESVASPALQVYYDIGNATNLGGFDAPAEIRFLGRERICQFHVKDQGYLGAGKVNVPACIAAMRDIGYEGWTILETSSPSGDLTKDAARNLEIFRRMLAEAA